MQGMPAGTPGFMPSQPSSLPMKQALASLCVRIWLTVSCASVGYRGTDTYPAIQIARSLMSHQAQFFDRMATLEPGARAHRLGECNPVRLGLLPMVKAL